MTTHPTQPQPLTEAELDELEAVERAAREIEAEMIRVGQQQGAVAAYIGLGGKLREARNSLYVRALEQMGRVLAEVRAARRMREVVKAHALELVTESVGECRAPSAHVMAIFNAIASRAGDGEEGSE